MAQGVVLDDLNFTAFMSSKICHDLVGPVGAINNGLELLEEETDQQTRDYALELIQFSADVARKRLEFARLAFGASSALGSTVDLRHAEKIARAFVEEGKHKLHWTASCDELEKHRLRLLLTLITIAMTAVPAGGDLSVTVSGESETADIEIRCSGRGARMPAGIEALLSGDHEEINPRSIVDYYAVRLAESCGAPLTLQKDGEDIVLAAKTARR